VRWNKRDYRGLSSGRFNEAAVVAERKWQFKTKLCAKAYGWRGSHLAVSRLKEAVSEIKAAAKSDPGRGRRWCNIERDLSSPDH
jgi:hypothetical protein